MNKIPTPEDARKVAEIHRQRAGAILAEPSATMGDRARAQDLAAWHERWARDFDELAAEVIK